MQKYNKILIFSFGVAVGAFASWIVAKDKYKKIADDEISSVKEVYRKKAEKETEEEKNNYEEIAKTYVMTTDDTEDKDDALSPYVISPDEYGNNTDNACAVLMWYGDECLTDTYGININDIDATVGRDFIDRFGENPEEPDVVYVRNNRLEMDYQILQCSGEED